MQIARGMKIDQAKKHVADKLAVSVTDLTDPIIMNEVREDLSLGLLHPHGGSPRCMEAKFNIATLLDIDINCVNRFKQKASL
jgi:dimethylamine--corrinoid protein Co-methyltransferase